jgi:hypothetical protein
MKYEGLWRGVVVNNNDALSGSPHLGRIQVSIPEVYGNPDNPEDLPWAWPCSMMGGGLYSPAQEQAVSSGEPSDTAIASGLTAVPSIGATVWVAFEHGDPQSPVWLGTWNGRSAETPAAAKQATGGQYPNIFVLKMPWGKDIYLQFVEDRMLEISFGSMKLQMVGETSPGAKNGQMKLLADTESIVVQSNTGSVVLRGATVLIAGLTQTTLSAGTFKLDPTTGKPVVDTQGSLLIQASKDSRIFTEGVARIQAGEKGAIYAQAPTTSGFEQHTPVVVGQG